MEFDAFTAGIFSKENEIPCHMTHNSPFYGFFSPFNATLEVPEKMPQEKKKEDARVVKKMALEPDRSH